MTQVGASPPAVAALCLLSSPGQATPITAFAAVESCRVIQASSSSSFASWPGGNDASPPHWPGFFHGGAAVPSVVPPVDEIRISGAAGVVEMEDTPALGAGARESMGVRVPPPAWLGVARVQPSP